MKNTTIDILKIQQNEIPNEIVNSHPILKYRLDNFKNKIDVRGLSESDSHTCYLIQDDSVIAGNKTFPCVIYMREGGNAICDVGPDMREKRIEWMKNHNSYNDKICRECCLDICISYNNRAEEYANEIDF